MEVLERERMMNMRTSARGIAPLLVPGKVIGR
jgi:hypothetical protein